MKQQTRKLGSATLIVALFGSALTATAGSLTPPTGPILPTNRVQINQQFGGLPITISQSGSYVLTGNIVAEYGYTGNGIVISAQFVTLDLNGFHIKGAGPGSGTGIMWPCCGGEDASTVRNGTVFNWGSDGVRFGGPTGSDNSCENLLVSFNGGNGIHMTGAGRITGCIATNNNLDGIFVDGLVTISNCIADLNDHHGINFGTSTHARVLSSAATNNLYDGITGGLLSISVTDCLSSGNRLFGISVGPESTVIGNTCIDNGITTESGIKVVSGTLVKENRVHNNTRAGILVTGTGNTIIKNVATGNSSWNYSIVGGNDVGPIGTAAASTSPWANISN